MNTRKNAFPSSDEQPLSHRSSTGAPPPHPFHLSDYQRSMLQELAASHRQILLLVHQLTRPEEGLTQIPLSDIVHRIGLHRATVLHQVETLVTLGLLYKLPDAEADGRVHLRLTPSGRRLLLHLL